MFEIQLAKSLRAAFNLNVYAFRVPTSEKGTCLVYTNAGRGLYQGYFDGNASEIITRVIKLTKSAKTYEEIIDDSKIYKYIKELTKLGDIQILTARIDNFFDLEDENNEFYERTYTITFKFKEN